MRGRRVPDPPGNWDEFVDNDVTQIRDHNLANELTVTDQIDTVEHSRIDVVK